jgi:hypothetical protein
MSTGKRVLSIQQSAVSVQQINYEIELIVSWDRASNPASQDAQRLSSKAAGENQPKA